MLGNIALHARQDPLSTGTLMLSGDASASLPTQLLASSNIRPSPASDAGGETKLSGLCWRLRLGAAADSPLPLIMPLPGPGQDTCSGFLLGSVCLEALIPLDTIKRQQV